MKYPLIGTKTGTRGLLLMHKNYFDKIIEDFPLQSCQHSIFAKIDFYHEKLNVSFQKDIPIQTTEM